jgi:sulfite exporter TauE/SafE
VIALAASVLLASLLGSPHCAGMCGGFVAFYSGGLDRGRWGPHVAYNGGRLVSYTLLGAIAGTIGAGVDHVGVLAGVGRVAGLLAGLVMVVWGAGTLLAAMGVAVRQPTAPAALKRSLLVALKAVHSQPPAVRGLVMGLVTTLIPCGWLYAFVTLAAGTSGALAGAATMAVFWLGTLPMMAGLGLAAQGAFGPLRRRLPVLTAALLLGVGLFTVANKLRPMPPMAHHMPGMTMPTAAPQGMHGHR